jgi:pyrroloquinoline quinone biosynthesis protein D
MHVEDWLSSTAERGLSVHAGDRPRLGDRFSLRGGDTPEACWLVNGDRTVLLNETAGEILIRCNGSRTVAVLIEELRVLYRGTSSEEISAAVASFLELALSRGWIALEHSPAARAATA